ncbi:unnamed protein product [Cylicostephanus goldi]|uniref:Peroxin-14 n=1 Tax=Cylicostephanus goldi TaxID=71465 RepID=A0A3P7M6F0_CYLGO|nr:unnamed protein product [Cylicostephanus goldi]
MASFAQSVAVIGCVSYAGYRFLRSFVLPRFFDIPDPATEEVRQLQGQVNELQNSIKFVLDSVSQTTSMLAAQQQEISKALLSVSQRDTDISKVETGISTIKSLLLSHNNFAPILAPTATSAKLPSWQQVCKVSLQLTASVECCCVSLGGVIVLGSCYNLRLHDTSRKLQREFGRT